MALSKYAKQLNKERALAPYIPYSSHVSEDTILTKDGDFLRIWKIGGIGFESADLNEIVLRKEQLNTLLRAIGGNSVAIWTHQIRRCMSDKLDSTYTNDFCEHYDNKYYSSFSGYKMMANELYFTLVYRPNISKIGKQFSKAGKRSAEDIKLSHKEALAKLDDLSLQVEASLKKYDIVRLTTIKAEDEGIFSEPLTLLNFLLSGLWQKIRVPAGPLNDYLGNAWVFAGKDTIEIRHPTQTRYAQGIDFKDYPAHTEPGILNNMMYEDYEFVITQSFSPLSRRDGLNFLDKQQKQFRNSGEGSVTQIDEMSFATDQLIQGAFCMGEYHFSLMVFGETLEKVAKNRSSAMAILQNLGFLASSISIATDAAFFAQLPCNWGYRPRIAVLTSKNFASLSPFHNFIAGKRDFNPWGPAVTLFKTPSGQPLYFNFHYSKEDDDAFDKKVLGNTRIIGQSGAGKTVLMAHLLCQSQKFKYQSQTGYTDVFFDKDHGAELIIRRLGGKYLSIKNGEPTGLNPFQMEPTEGNILFLERLVKTLIKGDTTAEDDIKISHAVRTLMRMPREVRRLSILVQNITEGTSREEKENSIVKRLSPWCENAINGRPGALWWVLDCPQDQIDFTNHTSYGFDGTDFLDNEAIRTPISMYLLHRMESIIDGRRFIYFMDEAWKWVDDVAFGDFVGNKQLTIRKQNGLGVFATQMPSSLLKSKIASQLVQQTATEIYLPNPKADRSEYIDGFKVTQAEYDIIRNFNEESRLFLIKQGSQSAIGKLDLRGFDDELAILSGSADNIELLHDIVAEVGEDPKVWEPVFHARRKQRILLSKQLKSED